jgi:steroid 5-alpha reductase family enzyme
MLSSQLVKIKQSRKAGFLIIMLVYLLAFAAGFLMFRSLSGYSLLWRLFWSDIVATVFVFLAGSLWHNASVYDPYWSVAPPVILTAVMFHENYFSSGYLLLLLLVWFWGVRLTWNWTLTFRDLNHQDWRYDLFKQKFPILYPLINLTGIHLFPTCVVFSVLIPAIVYGGSGEVNSLTLAAAAISLAATLLQLVSDRQMQQFRRENSDPGRIIDVGLWKHARHPNYLAEIMMWWGIGLMLVSVLPRYWYLLAGPLLNTLMFLVISIPMAEKRLRDRKPGFEEYKESTRLFLPIRKNIIFSNHEKSI